MFPETQVIETLMIYGVAAAPADVQVDGQSVPFTFQNDTLEIDGLSIALKASGSLVVILPAQNSVQM